MEKKLGALLVLVGAGCVPPPPGVLSFDNKKNKRECTGLFVWLIWWWNDDGGHEVSISVRRVATKGISQVVTYHTAGKSRDGIQFHISKSDV